MENGIVSLFSSALVHLSLHLEPSLIYPQGGYPIRRSRQYTVLVLLVRNK